MNSVEMTKVLREKTLDLHHQLEQETLLSNLRSIEITESQYQQCIMRFFLFYSAWMDDMLAFNIEADIPEQLHVVNPLTALKDELANYPLARSHDIGVNRIKIESVEQYLGVSYVLNGSILGSKVLLRKLQNSHLINYNFIYFKAMATSNFLTKISWQTWCQTFNKFTADNNLNRELILSTAKYTFESLIQLFGYPDGQGDRVNA